MRKYASPAAPQPPFPALRPHDPRPGLDRRPSGDNLCPMTTTTPSGPAPRWDRARLIPTRRQLVLVVVLSVVAAVLLLPVTHNPYIELLGETLFVGMVLLFGFTLAGVMAAQIEPHFLLNTLANVQQLSESGSPNAVPVFRSLIA